MKILERYWRKTFEWSLLLKGFNGVWELVSGFLVLVVSKATFDKIFQFLARKELLEDPHDLLLNFINNLLAGLSNDAKIFAAIYILLHGALNIFLAIELHRNRIWAYLVAVWVMGLILVYQAYRFYLYHSLLLLTIAIFDIFFIFLTWHEYKVVKQERDSIAIQ